jgi:leader peptidase (prepilin peptidase)/N-methyltransferase
MPDAHGLASISVAPFLGSFLGMLACRLPESRPFAGGRSCCDGCGRTLHAAELIPIVSWTVLRGRCRDCGAAIRWEHPVCEIGLLLAAGWAAWVTTGAAVVWLSLVLAAFLVCISVIDLRHQIVPDALSLPMLMAGLASTALLQPAALLWHVLAAAAGYVVIAGVRAAYRKWRGIEGIGLGDAKLFAAAGAWLDLSGLPTALLYAAFIGILAVLFLSMFKKRFLGAQTRLPFGPFLAVGIWLVWLYGPLV